MTDSVIEAMADALDKADIGHSIRLTRLVDNESTYTATCNGKTRDFDDLDDASEWVSGLKRIARATAALSACREALMVEGARAMQEVVKGEADEYVAYHDHNDDGLPGFDKMAQGARELSDIIQERDPVQIVKERINAVQ